jgi:hypothetical protein
MEMRFLHLHFSACQKRDIISSKCTRTISYNFCVTLAFLIALTREEEIGTRSGRAGPSFSVRPEKEAKGAVLHGTLAAKRLRHVKSRSANLPKLNASRRLKHMGRFVFAPAVRGRSKNPLTSHAESCCGRCLGLPTAPSGAGSKSDQKPCSFMRFFLLLDFIDKLKNGDAFFASPFLCASF